MTPAKADNVCSVKSWRASWALPGAEPPGPSGAGVPPGACPTGAGLRGPRACALTEDGAVRSAAGNVPASRPAGGPERTGPRASGLGASVGGNAVGLIGAMNLFQGKPPADCAKKACVLVNETFQPSPRAFRIAGSSRWSITVSLIGPTCL